MSIKINLKTVDCVADNIRPSSNFIVENMILTGGKKTQSISLMKFVFKIVLFSTYNSISKTYFVRIHNLMFRYSINVYTYNMFSAHIFF